MRPYEADHVLYLENGYLLVEGGGNPWNDTLSAYRVLVRDSIPADAYAVGSGSASAIAAAVWGESATAYTTPGTFGYYLDRLFKEGTHKVTRSGDVITIYESNGIDVMIQYDLASGGRVEV